MYQVMLPQRDQKNMFTLPQRCHITEEKWDRSVNFTNEVNRNRAQQLFQQNGGTLEDVTTYKNIWAVSVLKNFTLDVMGLVHRIDNK